MKKSGAILVLSMTVAFHAFSEGQNPCPEDLAKITEASKPKVEWIDDKVSIIYFPHNWHTELRVDKNVLYTGHRYDAAVKAGKAAKITFIEFGIRVSPEELENLKLQSKKLLSISCTHLACRQLNKGAPTFIPMPFNIFPIANVLYLTLSRYLPGTRVIDIKIIGDLNKNSIKNLASAAFLETSWYFLISVQGSLLTKNFIVPIFSDKTADEDKNQNNKN